MTTDMAQDEVMTTGINGVEKCSKKLTAEFCDLCDKYGYAQVAVWLSYRDTVPIKKWVSRKKIPISKLILVDTIIKNIHRQEKKK